MASPGAVAIIETPNSFVLEGRPDLPGQLAYSGKLQLFGGHVGEETPSEAITRELGEELNFRPAETPLLLWAGEVDSRDRTGEPVKRYVSLFYVAVGSVTELDLQVPGEIVEIPKTRRDIEEHEDRLTPFAFRALMKTIMGEPWGRA